MSTSSNDPVWLHKVIRDLLDYPERPEALINARLAVNYPVGGDRAGAYENPSFDAIFGDDIG